MPLRLSPGFRLINSLHPKPRCGFHLGEDEEIHLLYSSDLHKFIDCSLNTTFT